MPATPPATGLNPAAWSIYPKDVTAESGKVTKEKERRRGLKKKKKKERDQNFSFEREKER